MTLSRASVGNLRMDTESSLGTAAGSAVYLRPEEVPALPTQTRHMIANANAGKRNPFNMDAKPQDIELFREDAISFAQRIRRAETDGGTPSLVTQLKSAGWTVETTDSATTISDASPQVGEFDLADDVTDEGESILVTSPASVYRPVLVASDVAGVITPSMALAAAPADSSIVEIMHTLTPTTATTYQVPTNQTLQFRWNSWAQYDDSLGDLSVLCSGCALSSIDSIEIGPVGSFPVLNMTYHVGKIDIAADDIAAETFVDSDEFALIDENFEFCFADASMSGAIANTPFSLEKMTINPNIEVRPVPSIGSGNYAGLGGYMLIPNPPTVSFTGYFTGSSTLENKIITELESDNTSMYIHAVQPTTNLDVPAFGFWMPNCHLVADDSFNIEMAGDNAIKFTANFMCSTSGYDSLTDIDEVEAAPIFFGISGEAA